MTRIHARVFNCHVVDGDFVGASGSGYRESSSSVAVETVSVVKNNKIFARRSVIMPSDH